MRKRYSPICENDFFLSKGDFNFVIGFYSKIVHKGRGKISDSSSVFVWPPIGGERFKGASRLCRLNRGDLIEQHFLWGDGVVPPTSDVMDVRVQPTRQPCCSLRLEGEKEFGFL